MSRQGFNFKSSQTNDNMLLFTKFSLKPSVEKGPSERFSTLILSDNTVAALLDYYKSYYEQTISKLNWFITEQRTILLQYYIVSCRCLFYSEKVL